MGVRIYIYICKGTHSYTTTHTHRHAQAHTDIHTCTTNTCRHTYTQTHMHYICLHTDTHAYTNAQTCRCAHTCWHTHTHAHTVMHTDCQSFNSTKQWTLLFHYLGLVRCQIIPRSCWSLWDWWYNMTTILGVHLYDSDFKPHILHPIYSTLAFSSPSLLSSSSSLFLYLLFYFFLFFSSLRSLINYFLIVKHQHSPDQTNLSLCIFCHITTQFLSNNNCDQGQVEQASPICHAVL